MQKDFSGGGLYGFPSLFGLFDVRQGFPFIYFFLLFFCFFVKAVVYFVYVFLIKVTTPQLDIVFFFLGTV